MSDSNVDRKYIAALDIGTTSLRCFIYDNNVEIIGKASDKVSRPIIQMTTDKDNVFFFF